MWDAVSNVVRQEVLVILGNIARKHTASVQRLNTIAAFDQVALSQGWGGREAGIRASSLSSAFAVAFCLCLGFGEKRTAV